MKKFLLLMLAAVALVACSENPTEDRVEPRAEITLQMNVSESSIVQTRVQSVAETTVNNLWLFVFNSSGTLTQKYKARFIRNDVHTADISIKEGTGLNLYACANILAVEEAKFNALAIGVAKVADLKAIITDRSLLRVPGLPMWGELLNQTIGASTTKINMTLTRSCSRVDVVASGVADFTFLGIEKLLKTANQAPIFPAGSLVTAGNVVSAVPIYNNLGSIYLYENAIDATTEDVRRNKATEIIIKGTYKGFTGFYKLRVKYGTSPEVYNIGRNVIYSINITGVKAPGFATLAEAEANLPQNVDYTTTASDGDATDLTTSNGQYYLGVTNSEYIAYNSDAMINVPVVTVTHNAPSSITAGTITASGTGLTLRISTILTNIQKQVISVDMTSGFTSGTLTLRLGNLIKVVTIKKKPSINISGGLNADYGVASYIQGDLDQAPTWFGFAKTAGGSAEATQRVQNPSGGIWMRFQPNLGLTNKVRYGGAYVSSNDSKGRARIEVQQEYGVLQYVSGIQAGDITPLNPPTIGYNVKTDLPGWSVIARSTGGNPIPITLENKTGVPRRGTPTDCSISVTMSNNLEGNRGINLFLTATEDPGLLQRIATFRQPALIVDPSVQENIPYSGGAYTITVISNRNWTQVAAVTNINPSSGSAGTTVVRFTVPQNPVTTPREIAIIFEDPNNNSATIGMWLGKQLGSPGPIPTPTGSYIPRSVLAAAGWPADKLPSVGLQIAMSGPAVYPGDTPSATPDPMVQWKTSNTATTGQLSHSLGKGKSNTDVLIAAGDTNHPAAYYCRRMGPEWYLPSETELDLIKQNRSLFDSNYLLSIGSYWSSTQYSATQAAVVDTTLSGNYVTQKTNSNVYVRCVRDI